MGDSWPEGGVARGEVMADGEVMAEEGEAIAVADLLPGEGQAWVVETGEAVLLLPSLPLRS